MKKLIFVLLMALIIGCNNKKQLPNPQKKQNIYTKVCLSDTFLSLYLKEQRNFSNYYRLAHKHMALYEFELAQDYIYEIELSMKKSSLYYKKHKEYFEIELNQIIKH